MGLTEKCEVKGCRKPADLRFYGKWICGEHYALDNIKEILGVTDKC